MGGCLGTLVEQAESMGLAQVNVPGEQGTFAPHSDESFGCLDVWVGDAKADGAKCTLLPASASSHPRPLLPPGLVTNSLDAEFADDMTTRRYLSAKIKPKFGVTREQKAMIRVRTEDGGNLSDMKDSLDGLDTELGPKNELLVLLCTYMPLCAPVGLYKDKATVSSSNGGSTKRTYGSSLFAAFSK